MTDALKKTATEMRMLPDLRRQRVGSVIHRVMQALDPFIDPDERRHVVDKLYDLFMEEGIEVLTDVTRQNFGLAPRDGEGWTEAELRTYDAIRIQKMLEPIKMTLPLGMKLTL